MKYLFIFIALLTSAFAQERFETLKVGTKEYKKVFVTKKDDAYISIMHEAGTTRVLRSDLLPDDVKLVGGYDPKKAKLVLDKEKELTKAEIDGRYKSTVAPKPAAPTTPKVEPAPVEQKPIRRQLKIGPLEKGTLQPSKKL